MPLFFQQHSNTHTLAVWHITESEAFFRKELPADQLDTAPLFLTEKRSLQWLASRYLLKALGCRDAVSHTENGKPFFANRELQLSISHSGTLAAVMISRSRAGLDLQQVSARILKIKSHFLAPSEQENGDVETLTRLWSAKETVIKLSPGMRIDEIKKIQIQPDPRQPERRLLGKVLHRGLERSFTLHSRSFDISGEKYVLVHAVNTEEKICNRRDAETQRVS